MEARWDRYLKHGELTELLRDLESRHRDLCTVYSVGKTWQGRDIWFAEITNTKTGPASRKPAVYLDGNTHAGEVTGSMICLYTIWYLLENYGRDEKVTSTLDTRAFYVIPRLSADGAELYLNEPYIPRSSIRPWPYDEDKDGLYPADIDGDGVIAQMRVQDENGQWRVSEKDPRVMVRRKPNEYGGTYYNIYGEGLIRNWNGVEVFDAPPKWGLDVNRNYAAYWQQDYIQSGAGPYPFSEPESRTVADFFESHKNITIAHSFHTFTGAVLRPPAAKPDKDVAPKDLKALKEIGAIGTEATGYPVVGIYEDFALNKDIPGKRPLWGTALEWMFEHMGAIAYSTEVWDFPNRAIGRLDTYKTLMDWSEDEQVLMQKWNDENLGGEGFINWRPFNHPQLGAVEIGGWKHKYVFQNPPPKFLERECRKNAMFCLESALTTPLVRITDVDVEEVSAGVYTIKVTVRNMGYLPTNVTDQAKKNKKASPVKAKIEIPQGVRLLGGKEEVEVGHLEGRLALGRAFGGSVQTKRLVQWTVYSPSAATLTISAGNPRGGYQERTITLGGCG
ncbi:MAG: M14 family metallopeptidase [Bacillota bacterium]|jgi:murein tripeptide amidase MpaA